MIKPPPLKLTGTAPLEDQFEMDEKIANASLHQRTDLLNRIDWLTAGLVAIRDLVEDRMDSDDGQPNLAMRVHSIVEVALSTK